MCPLDVAAGAGVAVSATWLIGLAVFIAIDAGRARQFLEKFASSFRAHALEQFLRLTAGMAFIGFSSEMRYPSAFEAFGWVLVVSAVLLLLLPWRLHQRFAGLVIPPLTRHLTMFGLSALLLGAIILYAMV